MKTLKKIWGLTMKINLKRALSLLAAVLCVSASPVAQAQMKLSNKVQLEDVSIKGEATKMGLNLFSRARNNLDGRILIRRDFRDRALEDLPGYYDSKTMVRSPAESAK